MHNSTYFSLAHAAENLAREIRAYHVRPLPQGTGSFSPLVRDAGFSMVGAAADQLREGRVPGYPAVAEFAEALRAEPAPWGEHALLWVGQIRVIMRAAVDLCACFDSIEQHGSIDPEGPPDAIKALNESAALLWGRFSRLVMPLMEPCYGPDEQLIPRS
jgi:hypothetical protein